MDEHTLDHMHERIARLKKQRATNTWWFRAMRSRPRVIACEVEHETEQHLMLAMAGAGRVRKDGPERYFATFEDAYHDMIARRERALTDATSAKERQRLHDELTYLRREYGPDGPCRLG